MADRKLYIIAEEIGRLWRPVSPAAEPYLLAMTQLDTITDVYGADNARTVVLYFLSNAASWRGADARRIKAELKQLLKAPPR